MARDYIFTFGSGNPSTKTGLSPTFIFFINSSTGATLTPPAIAETYSGSGFYKVNYNATLTVHFTMDGATTGLVTSDRYISGMFDPQDQFGTTLNAIAPMITTLGSTQTAIGTALFNQGVTVIANGALITSLGSSLSIVSGLIGDTSSSFGSTSVDPTTVFGFLKRAQEMGEGNQTYTKLTGILDFYSRGSSALLREKTITDDLTATIKT